MEGVCPEVGGECCSSVVDRQGSLFPAGVGVVERGELCWLGEGFWVYSELGGGAWGCFFLSNADTIFLTLPNMTGNS